MTDQLWGGSEEIDSPLRCLDNLQSAQLPPTQVLIESCLLKAIDSRVGSILQSHKGSCIHKQQYELVSSSERLIYL